MNIDQFLTKITLANPSTNQDLVRKAYEWAEQGHAGYTRKGGEAYFVHPIAVALQLKGNSDNIICAALLHDLVEDTEIIIDQIKQEFGDDIALLVDGVTKPPKPQNKDYDRLEYQTKKQDKLRHYFKLDKRILLIKLADRRHNLTTLSVFRAEKQQRIARETIEFYLPLAKEYGFDQYVDELTKLAEQYI